MLIFRYPHNAVFCFFVSLFFKKNNNKHLGYKFSNNNKIAQHQFMGTEKILQNENITKKCALSLFSQVNALRIRLILLN